MKKLIGVYFIKNKITNKFYIGHSVDIEKRFTAHRSYLKRNTHHCLYLQRAWNKYGENNFEFIIVRLCDSENQSIELEQYYLNKLKNHIYNTSNYAKFGGDLLSNNPNKEEIIKRRISTQKENLLKMSKEERILKFSRIGAKNGMYGKKHSEKTKNIISSRHKGKAPINKGKKLEESVGILRAESIKSLLSDLAKNRIGSINPFYGKHHSEETKLKLHEIMKGKKPVNMKKVKIDNVVYESVTEASRQINVSPATIIYRIKSKNYYNYEYYDI